MKNVKPMVGQVWAGNQSKSKWEVNLVGVDGLIHCVLGAYAATPLPMNEFVELFTFIPQNDLEWLAVTMNVWTRPRDCYIVRSGDEIIYYAGSKPTRVSYSYQEWQNMRYELGLDEKTFAETYREFDKQLKLDREEEIEKEIRNCPVRGPALKKIEEIVGKIRSDLCDCLLNKKPKREIYGVREAQELAQKETKMIDLNHCKIDDKFVTARGLVMTVFAFGDNSVVMQDEEGQFNVFDIDSGCVITFKTGPQYDIASKVESRWWLNCLPDASHFELYGTYFIGCNTSGEWYASNGRDVDSDIILDNRLMPTLATDEWHNSKILIPDLKAWQITNKRGE